MFCINCGKELPEGAKVCPECGEKIEKELKFDDVKTYAGQKAQQASKAVQSQAQQSVQDFQTNMQTWREGEESRKASDLNEIFVDPEEQQIAVIGGGYLSNMLHGGKLSKGFGILTNRRLYFRGKSFTTVAGKLVKNDEDRVVDLQDITSSGFLYIRRIWLMVSSILMMGLGLYFGIANRRRRNILSWGDFFAWVIPALIVLLIYVLAKRTLYTVTFAGGSLSIKASSYGVKDVREFDKALHKEKDTFLAAHLYKNESTRG